MAGRILAALAGSPAGFSTEELCRQCGNGKGASPAMIDMVLIRLFKQGDVGKVNDRWVSMVRGEAALSAETLRSGLNWWRVFGRYS